MRGEKREEKGREKKEDGWESEKEMEMREGRE